jgi:ribosome-binding factor A
MAKRKSSSGAPSQRQLRVGEVIRRRMAETLQRGEIHDPDLNRFSITVSEVRCTPDLSIATAFVLPLGGDGKEEMLAALARNKGEIRHQVSKALQIKHVPEIRFMIDDTFDRMDATRAMLSEDHVRQDLDD